MSSITLEMLAPERTAVRLVADEVLLPGAAGVLAVLEGHTPLLTLLTPGVVIVYDEEHKKHAYAISGGFAEVVENKISILTEAFEHGRDIDLARAEAARARAEERLRKPAAELDVARAELAIARALARIDAHSGREY